MKFGAIITAGGTSSRFGNTNKLLEKINNKEIIKYTVEAFIQADIEDIVICSNSSIIEIMSKMRQESVFNGLKVLDSDYVLIHDGARPMITTQIIKNTITSVVEKKAVSVMTKTIDTIKEVDEQGRIIKTIDRSKLYNTQTPQAFEYKLIRQAHETLIDKSFTDDAGMVEFLGKDVYIVEGDYRNIKVTTKSDLALAKTYLEEIHGQ